MSEQFFISSPIGYLSIFLKKNKLYSISKVNPQTLSVEGSKAQFYFFQMIDKNSLYAFDAGFQKIVREQKISPFAQLVKNQIEDYFHGRLKEFDIPLFERGTDFQKKVWKSLQKIPWGYTKTYGQLAEQLEIPKGSRAIGNCCAKNPFIMVVPCHRVVSKKSLGGFALGLSAKQYLLSLERKGQPF